MTKGKRKGGGWPTKPVKRRKKKGCPNSMRTRNKARGREFLPSSTGGVEWGKTVIFQKMKHKERQHFNPEEQRSATNSRNKGGGDENIPSQEVKVKDNGLISSTKKKLVIFCKNRRRTRKSRQGGRVQLQTW